ncbi:retrovirus-related pol polyprotein from transposon TNT 1-94 [Tanacetum coccineum]
MDLFGPVTSRSINHEKYTLIIVDEYSRYTWVYFLKKKSQAPETIMSFTKRVKNQNDIKQLRTDNGTEFKKSILVNFCDEKGISQNFSSPYTPEQNSVAERKNRTLIEAARTMLSGSKIPNINFLHVFGCPVYIHNHKDHLRKFDEKADDGYLLGYSLVTKAFRTDEIFNDNMSEHSNHNNNEQIIDNLLNTKDIQISEHVSSSKVEDTSLQDTTSIINPPLPISSVVTPAPQDRWSQDKNIELVNIIGNPRAGMLTRAMAKQLSAASAHECLFVDFLSEEEPKKVSEALKHPGWVDAMQDELNQFAKNKVWTLVPTTLEAIRIFLAFATYMNFIVYQMDVKSAFLNGKLKEEVYVKQPPGFESNEFPNHVCKLDKALYGLKQAPRAWYETLSTFLNEHKFVRVKTPMVPPNNIGPDLSGKAVNETQYRGMIGSLMYLTASGHDIQFSTCLCARYQANSKESNLIVSHHAKAETRGATRKGIITTLWRL